MGHPVDESLKLVIVNGNFEIANGPSIWRFFYVYGICTWGHLKVNLAEEYTDVGLWPRLFRFTFSVVLIILNEVRIEIEITELIVH